MQINGMNLIHQITDCVENHFKDFNVALVAEEKKEWMEHGTEIRSIYRSLQSLFMLDVVSTISTAQTHTEIDPAVLFRIIHESIIFKLTSIFVWIGSRCWIREYGTAIKFYVNCSCIVIADARTQFLHQLHTLIFAAQLCDCELKTYILNVCSECST